MRPASGGEWVYDDNVTWLWGWRAWIPGGGFMRKLCSR